MPYTGEEGKLYNSTEVEKVKLDTVGDLNRVFTEFALRYEKLHGKSKATTASVLGAYFFSMLEYHRRRGDPFLDLSRVETSVHSYTQANNLVGSQILTNLDDYKLSIPLNKLVYFYRQEVVPYENKKIKENGDCY